MIYLQEAKDAFSNATLAHADIIRSDIETYGHHCYEAEGDIYVVVDKTTSQAEQAVRDLNATHEYLTRRGRELKPHDLLGAVGTIMSDYVTDPTKEFKGVYYAL